MVIDSRQKRFVICSSDNVLSEPSLSDWKKIKKKKPDFYWYFLFSIKAKCVKKSLNFKIWLQKCQIGNPARDCMGPPPLGRSNCCITRPDMGPPWLSEKIRTVRFMVFLQFLAYYLILLDLQLINFPRACTISREAPSRFPHFLQPCSWHRSSPSGNTRFETQFYKTQSWRFQVSVTSLLSWDFE